MATKKTVAKATPIDDKAARKKALSTALAQLEKDFGAGAVMKLGENTHMEDQELSPLPCSYRRLHQNSHTDGTPDPSRGPWYCLSHP